MSVEVGLYFDGTELLPNPVVQINCCYLNSDGLVTSEFYQDGTFSEGPRLPNEMNRNCAVEVEPGFVLISGNSISGYEKTAFGFYPETGAFESLADMTQERRSHGCGVVRNGNS